MCPRGRRCARAYSRNLLHFAALPDFAAQSRTCGDVLAPGQTAEVLRIVCVQEVQHTHDTCPARAGQVALESPSRAGRSRGHRLISAPARSVGHDHVVQIPALGQGFHDHVVQILALGSFGPNFLHLDFRAFSTYFQKASGGDRPGTRLVSSLFLFTNSRSSRMDFAYSCVLLGSIRFTCDQTSRRDFLPPTSRHVDSRIKSLENDSVPASLKPG